MQFGFNFANFGYLGDVNRLAELASDAEAAGWDAVFLSGTPPAIAWPWPHLTLQVSIVPSTLLPERAQEAPPPAFPWTHAPARRRHPPMMFICDAQSRFSPMGGVYVGDAAWRPSSRT